MRSSPLRRGFVAFLYVMPPLTLTAPEEFVGIEAAMTPTVERIDDPADQDDASNLHAEAN